MFLLFTLMTRFLLFILTIAITATSYAADEKIQIASTMPAFGLLAKDIGGNYVEIREVYPATHDPHLIVLNPTQFLELSQADLVISSKIFAKKLRYQLKNILELENNSDECCSAHHHHDHDHHSHNHHHHDVLAHEWLSFEYSRQLSWQLKNELIKRMPSQKDYFEGNYERFNQELQLIRKRFSHPTSKKKVVIYHDSFFHLAHELHTEFGPALVTCEESSISPRDLQTLSEHKDDFSALIVETTTPPNLVQKLSAQLSLPVVVIDTVGLRSYTSFPDFLNTILAQLLPPEDNNKVKI